MSEADALLAAIRGSPDDDAPRLIYADWLDEHGQPERAEFIRVQVALARAESPELKRREAELLKEHHDLLAGPLASPDFRFRFERGFAVGFGHTGVFESQHRPLTLYLRLYPEGTVILTHDHERFIERFGDELRVSEHFARRNKYFPSDTYTLDAIAAPFELKFDCRVDPRGELRFDGTFDGTILRPGLSTRIYENRVFRQPFRHIRIEGVDSFDDPTAR